MLCLHLFLYIIDISSWYIYCCGVHCVNIDAIIKRFKMQTHQTKTIFCVLLVTIEPYIFQIFALHYSSAWCALKGSISLIGQLLSSFYWSNQFFLCLLIPQITCFTFFFFLLLYSWCSFADRLVCSCFYYLILERHSFRSFYVLLYFLVFRRHLPSIEFEHHMPLETSFQLAYTNTHTHTQKYQTHSMQHPSNEQSSRQEPSFRMAKQKSNNVKQRRADESKHAFNFRYRISVFSCRFNFVPLNWLPLPIWSDAFLWVCCHTTE